MSSRMVGGVMGILAVLPAAMVAVFTVRPSAAEHDAGSKSAATGQTPLSGHHLYVCAFHIAKNNPRFQVEAHHYCGPHGESLHQCVLYDKVGANSKLLGVEYIIPDKVYRTLPESEKKYYHPHTYEILAGQLVAPNFSQEEEDKLMTGLLTTWGKTWHTWPDPTTPLPMGEPLLMWSITGDGQLDQRLLSDRDAHFNISSDAIREHRKSYGFKTPQLPPPASTDALGRQWTTEGPDEPTPTEGGGK